jgi:hypothetical protein
VEKIEVEKMEGDMCNMGFNPSVVLSGEDALRNTVHPNVAFSGFATPTPPEGVSCWVGHLTNGNI